MKTKLIINVWWALMMAVATPLLTIPRLTFAETIVSSLGSPSGIVLSPVLFPVGGWAASSFVTDNQYWTLTSATVGLSLGTFNTSYASLYLYSDNAGMPGAALADLGSQAVTGSSDSLYTFTAATTVTLNPSTTYWIGLGNVTPNGGLNVSLSESDMASFMNSGVPGSSMPYSTSSGTGIGSSPPSNWSPSSPTGALLFSVDGTPEVVPEPGFNQLFSLAGIMTCIGFESWRKQFAVAFRLAFRFR